MSFAHDDAYMREALDFARQAGGRGEVPIGALVVNPQGVVIGRGGNEVEKNKCQIDHAEACAIRSATQALGDWRLERCTLYVTLEPCMMCISLAALSRIERVVYGAQSPLFGYSLDKEGVLALYTKQIKNITSGVLAQEAMELLQSFFKKTRA